ncbi:hypothetical protein OIV83_001793 [Microbotryomycetes sp. JL201]|nr:hypothetical protein OIV83_001793 [Microbotryomycetes sp. JL201]
MPALVSSRAYYDPSPPPFDLNDDQLAFGDFCLSAPSTGPYCSTDCRKTDLVKSDPSPEDSPGLHALPALESSSARSDRSTPPSSPNSSPLAHGVINLGEDPPRLDLPAPAHKIQYGGHSLPIAIKYPVQPAPWAVDSNEPSKDKPSQAEDLILLRRRPHNKPAQMTPAPLYYRERAAQIHSSPALAPSSPRRASPPTFWSPQLVATTHVPRLDLSAAQTQPRVSRRESHGTTATRPADISNNGRRSSWTPHDAVTKQLKPTTAQQAEDILVSPRIQAFKSDRLPSIEQFADAASSPGDEGTPDDRHSAFADYLFSHLARKTGPSRQELEELARGRSTAQTLVQPDEKRSISIDPASLGPRGSPAPVASRPTRFMFSRGAGAQAASDREDEPIVRSSDVPLRPKLLPGHSMTATTDSPGVSPVATPHSPPTLGRGRSLTRRPSINDDDVHPAGKEALIESGRGRSHMRGAGAVERSLSPKAASRSRSRTSRAMSRGASNRGCDSRGRSRSIIEQDLAEVSTEDEFDGEEDRGRTRARSPRARSQSLLRRGRGREVVFSGAGYGHDEHDWA